ncbi:MAG: addiction module protein [Gemmataceae bacterium]|nr:addiction module protein [Gemmataceae bacterium]
MGASAASSQGSSAASAVTGGKSWPEFMESRYAAADEWTRRFVLSPRRESVIMGLGGRTMNANVDSVLSVAESLTVPERHELIDRLLEGLPESSEKVELSDAWMAEIAKRSLELDAEATTTVAWSEIQARWRLRNGNRG